MTFEEKASSLTQFSSLAIPKKGDAPESTEIFALYYAVERKIGAEMNPVHCVNRSSLHNQKF